ncbi:MAG: MFS transporter [Anaerolineales bacterium]|nr:MAG: MFS transporter [Anaerolineales bacterium]
MKTKIRDAMGDFPAQFWFLVLGTLINSTGGFLVWPFLTLYLRQNMKVSMTTIGLLFTFTAPINFVSQVVGGSLADRWGRRIMMAVSLFASGLVMLGFGLAGSLPSLILLLVLNGIFGPLFGPASNAMIADLIEPQKRAQAYGLLRVVMNVGAAIGPSVGGFIATRSYFVLFFCAALTSLLYFLIVVAFVRETKPQRSTSLEETAEQGKEGWKTVLRDTPFLALCLITVLTCVVYSQMNTTFPVYLKENAGIGEVQYGQLMALNAVMVILLQFPITRITDRFSRRQMQMMALGAFLYALGFGSQGFVGTLPLFALSVAIWTLGEMVIAPVSTVLVADMSPETMRGRYMGVFGLTWGLGYGLGPTLGGTVMDNLGGRYIWYASLILGLMAAVAFLLLGRFMPSPAGASESTETTHRLRPGLAIRERYRRCLVRLGERLVTWGDQLQTGSATESHTTQSN